MFDSSVIQVSKSAYKNNINYLLNRFGSETVFSSVVKGNAYGHGIPQIIPLAEECGIRHFSVFSANEAYTVSKSAGPGSGIMIMGFVEGDAVEWAVEQGISFYVFDMDRLERAVTASKKTGNKALIHIELETGMNRTGFDNNELDRVLPFIQKHLDFLEIKGLCTHFAGAESVGNYLRIKEQMKQFSKFVRLINRKGLPYQKLHTACSAAAIRYKRTIMDMVRIGIAQYGLWPNRETYMHDLMENHPDEPGIDPLKRVISWNSRVMSLKNIPPNRFVGYGTGFLTNEKTTIATVPVGYTHGFNRNLSNLGHVLIGGKRAPVIGMVNMNMMSVNVTHIDAVKKGDEVVIIGEQLGEGLTVSSFSEMTHKLNYETLSRLPKDLPRVVVD